jgi:hypothetical protein
MKATLDRLKETINEDPKITFIFRRGGSAAVDDFLGHHKVLTSHNQTFSYGDWGYIKNKVYGRNLTTLDEFKNAIVASFCEVSVDG